MIILNITEWIVSLLIISVSLLMSGCGILIWSIIFSIFIEWIQKIFKKGEHK